MSKRMNHPGVREAFLKRYILDPRLLPAVILFYILSANILTAGVNTTADTTRLALKTTLLQDGRHFLATGAAVVQAPLHFHASGWQKAGLIAGTAAVLFTVDRDVRSFALSNHSRLNDNIFNFDHYHGTGYTLIFSAAVYGGGLFTGNTRVRVAGLQAVEAFLYAGALSTMFKVIIGRRRPYAGESQLVFRPFRKATAYNSLPSGHSTVAFAVSTVMARSMDHFWWKALWYGSAGMVAASRVYHNAHWLSDVFTGGALGYTVATFIVGRGYSGRVQGAKTARVSVHPWFSVNRAGVQLSF